MTKVEMVSSFKREPLPGIEMLTTEAARLVADRTQFRGGIGQHVYVNGYDLARVETAGLRDPRIVATLAAHGWYAPDGPMSVHWFMVGDTTFTKHSLLEAVLSTVAELDRATGFTAGFTDDPTRASDADSDLSAELEVARPAGLEPTTFRSAT